MLKLRPLIRYDGVYRCKITYLRDGLSENSVYHPIFEVTSYKYIRFLRSGQTLSLYTAEAPKKIFPKLKLHMLKGQLGLLKESYEAWSGDLQIISGTFEVYNDKVVVT
jgi:hypothetical protein